MKKYLLSTSIVLLCQLFGNPVNVQGLEPVAGKAFLKLKTQIEAHYFAYDQVAVQSLLDQALAQMETYPASWYPHYYAGLINIMLGNIARADDRKAAYRYYREAMEQMRIAYERAPIAENAIVLTDAYGKLASLRTFKMLYYGSKSKSCLFDAFELNERSPKNYLLAGIEIMWTPRIFGGSKERARKFLNTALALAPEWQEKDRLIVRWATPPEIFAHLAQLEILCETPGQARYYVTQALNLIPDYGFVLRDVIPQLD